MACFCETPQFGSPRWLMPPWKGGGLAWWDSFRAGWATNGSIVPLQLQLHGDDSLRNHGKLWSEDLVRLPEPPQLAPSILNLWHSFLCSSFPAPLSSVSSIWRKSFSVFGLKNVFIHVLTGNKGSREKRKTTCYYVFAQYLDFLVTLFHKGFIPVFCSGQPFSLFLVSFLDKQMVLSGS